MQRLVLGVLALSLPAAGCSTAGAPEAFEVIADHQAAEVIAAGDVVVAISSTIYEDDSDARAWLAVVRPDGRTSFLETEPQDSPQVASSEGRVLWAGHRTSFLAGERYTHWRRQGRQETGHWAGFAPGGSPVQVFNSGAGENGYVTEVFAGSGAGALRAVVPDVPGAVGLFGDDVWLLNAGSATIDGRVGVYRVPITGIKPDVAVAREFSYAYAGAEDGAVYDRVSNLVKHEDKLCHLEQITAVTADGSFGTFPDGSGAHLNLGCIQPKEQKYTSSFVKGFPASVLDTPAADGSSMPFAPAMADQGYLSEGALLRVVSDGTVLSVDLRTGRSETLVELSGAARSAGRAVVAWTDRELRILLLERDDGAAPLLETYHLDTGERASAVEVPQLSGVHELPGNPVVWTMAAVDRSS